MYYQEMRNFFNDIEYRVQNVVKDVNKRINNAVQDMNERINNAVQDMNERITRTFEGIYSTSKTIRKSTERGVESVHSKLVEFGDIMSGKDEKDKPSQDSDYMDKDRFELLYNLYNNHPLLLEQMVQLTTEIEKQPKELQDIQVALFFGALTKEQAKQRLLKWKLSRGGGAALFIRSGAPGQNLTALRFNKL